MESLGNGRWMADGGLDGSSVRERFRRQLDRWFRASLIGLLCLTLLASSVLHAQTSSYVYDANGRVVAITATNGTSVQYGYNSLGHTSQVSAPIAAGQLTIFAFAPTHGEAGAQVTIQGQGFDSNAANDTVTFNGVIATVLSASATQLVAAVPSGATTGPISVKVGTQTATSAASFVMDDTGLPPTIEQVSPLVTTVGSNITVTGTHLDPVGGATSVRMAELNVNASISDTQAQYTIPANAVSGHVTVQTPYGMATSVPVAILPASIANATQGSTSAYLVTNGSAVSFTNGVAGKLGVLTFDANQGDTVELTLSGLTITGSNASSVSVSVYNSAGTSVINSQTCYTTNPGQSCRLSLTNLAAGTYSAVITPADASSVFSLTAMAKTDVIGPTLVANTPVTVNLAMGEVERFTFHANAGDTVALQLAAVTTTPGSQNMYVQVYSPGTLPTANNYYTIFNTTGTTTVNLPNLPISGTWTAIVSIQSGTPGSGQLTFASGVSGSLSSNGSVQSYQSNVGGQNVYLNFSANAGDYLELTLNNLSITGSSETAFSINLYNANGTLVESQPCSTSTPGQSCRMSMTNLAAGAYQAVVVLSDPSAQISFNAMLKPDVIGPALVYNTPTTANLDVGEVEWLTFNANAGDTVALRLSGANTTPAGQAVYVQVYSPGTKPTASNYYTIFNTSGATTVNLPNLPSGGTWTAVVSIPSGIAGNAQLTVASGVTATLSANGNSQSFQANVPGQNAYLTFGANQGDTLELTLNGLTITGSGSTAVNANVYNAAGNLINNQTCYTTNPGQSCRLSLTNLAAGTYTAIISPTDTASQISFNAILEPDTIGPALTAGTPVTVNLAAGEVERFTFNANAGDAIALQLAGVSTSPAGQSMYVQVYSPGTVPTATNYYTIFSTASSTTVNLPNLPTSGAWTAIVSIPSGIPGSGQLTLIPGATGTVANNASYQHFQANGLGENIYLSFNANAGDNLEFTLSNINVSSGSNAVQVSFFNPSGTQVASKSCNGSSSPGPNCRTKLWNLVAGTYSIVVQPSNGGMMAFDALLQPDTIGPSLAANTPTNVNLSNGQVERLTFAANAGSTVTLNLSNVTTTPAGQGVYVNIYRPDVGVIGEYNECWGFSATGSNAITLSNLPVTGTYLLTVETIPGIPATAQMTLVPQ